MKSIVTKPRFSHADAEANCVQSSWIRSVTRAMELVSQRLHDVEREQFLLKILIGISTLLFLIITFFSIVSHYQKKTIIQEFLTSTREYSKISDDLAIMNESDQLTEDAWKLYTEKNYNRAIQKSQDCIGQFGKIAEYEENHLTEKNLPVPNTGDVNQLSKEQIKSIFQNDILNNVATCFYIQGLSYEASSQWIEARESYKNSQQFTHACTWNPVDKTIVQTLKAAEGRIAVISQKIQNEPGNS